MPATNGFARWSARYDRRVRLCGGSADVEAKRSRVARTAAACAVVLATLSALSPPASANVPPGRIISLIPSDDEVSQYMGLPMHHAIDPLPVRPGDTFHLDQRDECRLLLFQGSGEVWGSDYTAFRGQDWEYQPDPGRMSAGENVGTFLNAGAATDHFNAAFNPNLFNTCNHAIFRAPNVGAGTMLELFDFKIEQQFVGWTLAVTAGGQYTGWNAVFLAFHLDNVMAISYAGQDGNPAQAVKRFTDHILDRIG
jgi:hypothetical protein